MSEYILEMHDIVKEFPGVRALKGVELKVRPGTVHALMGENGAGKSTLMKCLIGVYHATSGTIIYDGKEVSFNSPIESLNAGISMVHQELSPVPERPVSENLWMGRIPTKGLFVDEKKMHDDARELFDRLGLDLDPDEKMGNLTVAKMQMVEIARAVSYNSRIVIMDEPTSALTETEVEYLFKIIEDLKKMNVAILYISHKMDEIFRISDDISVYRDGEFIYSDRAENLDIDRLIKLMVGREMTSVFPPIKPAGTETVLKVEGLSAGKAFHDVSFEVHKGEILGFAGLVGAGRTEIVETIFGMRTKTAGKVIKDGRELNITCPEDAIKNRIGLLTEDRRLNGIVGLQSVEVNTILANIKSYGFVLDKKRMREDAQKYREALNVKTPTLDQLIMNLSGGNQQKVLIGRWLLTNPDVLIMDEPTRGIDIGAKSEIYNLIAQLASEGKAIIMISSELPEVLGMSHRILVMHEGEMTGILDRDEANSDNIMAYATGHGQK